LRHLDMTNSSDSPSSLPKEILNYYDRGKEAERLSTGIGPLELARTQELITRYFPPPPAVVFDVGGGPGVYSCWLAKSGYEVHLIDAVPLHVEQARRASQAQPSHPIASLKVGDARKLDYPDASADAVLLHGPLYHLTDREDRLAAIRESKRILRPGGVLLGVGVSRYASTHAGLVRWLIDDPAYLQMCKRELTDGHHVPPPSWPGLFTTAFFHHPDELKTEMEDAGLIHEETLAVQGPGWLVPEFEERWKDEVQRKVLLKVIRWMEKEPVALGMSPHIVAVARNAQ
jgi:ubiquinone/menaquinone biosynthesis C-methylase UbiE